MALPEHWVDDWRSWVPDHRAQEVAFAGFQGEYQDFAAGNTAVKEQVGEKKFNILVI